MKRVIGQCPLGSKCEEAGEVNGEQVLIVCPWYIQLRGKNPQSTEEIDEFGCAISWGPVLTIENTQMQRQTGAAVESLRNNIVKESQRLSSKGGPKKEIVSG